MIAWIRENAILASVLGGFIAVISSGAVAYYQLSELIAKQPHVDQHVNDTTKHVDPLRDPVIHKQWEEKIQKLEMKVDQLERQQRWAERRQGGSRDREGMRGDRQ